jgi:hypothetical protein
MSTVDVKNVRVASTKKTEKHVRVKKTHEEERQRKRINYLRNVYSDPIRYEQYLARTRDRMFRTNLFKRVFKFKAKNDGEIL